jgi:hypothetical protein
VPGEAGIARPLRVGIHSSAVTNIPHQVAEIDAPWLNQVLAGSVGAIASVELERLGEGVGILGELARLRLNYQPGQDGPATMIAKCQSPSPENQFLSQMMGFYQREVSFYQHEAAHVGIRVPHPYHAAIDDSGTPFVLLIEDIDGARCPDQIAGIAESEARRIIDVVAGLHARYWTSASELAWLPPMNNPLYKAGQQLAEMRWPGFAERFGDRIDPAMMTVVKTACDNYAAMLDFVATDGHTTFTHTDCRAENYLFIDDEQPPVMIDFQLCTRHFGPWDVANLVGGSMSADIRRATETSLVEHYHAALVARGVTGYTLDRCWRDYRLSLLQMCTASVIVSDLQGGNDRGAELLENLFLRPIMAATDHQVGDLLAEFC